MTPHEEAFYRAFPWLTDFQRGWDTTPSADTLDAAAADFRQVFRHGGPRQVEAFLTWLRPEKMSIPAFDCLLMAAADAGVRLPTWRRHREKVEEVLSARATSKIGSHR